MGGACAGDDEGSADRDDVEQRDAQSDVAHNLHTARGEREFERV